MTRALAVLTLVAGLAVLVHAPAGSRGATPPHVEVQNAALLHVAGGHLWWVGTTCRPTRYALASGRLTVSARRYCLIWPSPDGTETLAAGTAAAFPAPPGRMAVLSGASLGTVALTPIREDRIAPPAVWSSDGRLALVCVAGRSAPIATLDLVERPWRQVRTLSHRCTPAFAGNAVLSSSRRGNLYDNNRRYHINGALRAGVGRHLGVTAMAFSQGQLAVAVARRSRSQIVIIDTTTREVQRYRTTGPVREIAVSPDGSELWYKLPTTDKRVLLPLDGRVQLGDVPGKADAYAWSPDGRFIAAAQNNSVQVFDRRTGRSATIATGAVTTLAWTA
jgi:WD40 repeat protein